MSAAPGRLRATGAALASEAPRIARRLLEWRFGPFVVFGVFVLALSPGLLPANHRVLSYADGPYFWPSGGFDFLSTWQSSNLGFPFIAQSFTAFQYLPWKLTQPVFTFLGDGYHAYVLYKVPFYTAALAAFFLGRRVSGSLLFGYFAGLFIFLNSFILEQVLVWPIGYLWCLTGSLLQIRVLWDIHEEGATWRRVAAAVLVSFLVHHPFWFLINLSMQAFLLAPILLRRRARLRHALAIVAGTLVIQSFWLVPFLYNLFAFSVAETHRGSGESAFAGYVSTIAYRSMFNLMNYPFNLNPPIWENIHGVGQTLFNFGIVAVLVALLMGAIRRGAPRLADMLFFLGLYLFFFNFALGPNSEITGALWTWAYQNVPGFAFLRSFNRFNIAAVLSLLLLGALLFRGFEPRARRRALAALIVADLACFAVYFSPNYHGMLAMAEIPAEYYRLNERYFKVDKGTVLLSLPHTPYESYGWAINRRNDLTGQGIYFLSVGYFPNATVILNGYSYNIERQYPDYNDIFQFHYAWRPLDAAAHENLRELGVTHVLIQKDRIDTLQKNDRVLPWKSLREEFASNPRYVLKEENDVFAFFEVKDALPLVSGPNVEFRAVTQTRYEVRVRAMAAPVQLKLAQSFSTGWHIYPAEEVASGAAQGIEKNRLHLADLARTFREPVLPAARHREVDGFANAWALDPAELRAKLPPGSVHANPDGTIDATFMIYFRPQGYLVLGVLITAFAVIACVVALMAPPLARAAPKDPKRLQARES